MANPKLPEDKVKLAQHYLDAGFCHNRIAEEVTKRLGLTSLNQIRKWIEKGHLKRPLFNTTIYNDYFRLSGDWVVSSDYHIPYSDQELIENMIKVAKKFKISNLLVAGDFLDMAMFSEYFIQEEGSFEEELETAREVLKLLSGHFKDVRFLAGNHDIRMLRKLEFKLNVKNFFQMLDKDLKVSKYPYCTINDRWRITHPKTYSRLSTRVAYFMTHKHKMHIGVAHGHAMGVTYSPSGEEICFDTGGMFQRDRIEYVNLIDTTHPMWTSGFSIIKNNHLYLFPKAHTDWNFWLNKVRFLA